VVIPWRDEGDRGACLRFALRSLMNLPHHDVVVVGDLLPEWATGIRNIVRDQDKNRYDDGQANVLTGLAHTDRDYAYIYHDDFIVTRPVDWIAPCHRGLLSDYRREGDYYRRAAVMRTYLVSQGVEHPQNFNMHLPFLVNTDTYLKIAEQTAHLPPGFRQSAYGNLAGLKTRFVYDPKVVAAGARPRSAWPVWSMSDRSFKSGYVGREVQRRFRTPSRYEVGSNQHSQEKDKQL